MLTSQLSPQEAQRCERYRGAAAPIQQDPPASIKGHYHRCFRSYLSASRSCLRPWPEDEGGEGSWAAQPQTWAETTASRGTHTVVTWTPWASLVSSCRRAGCRYRDSG